MVLQEREQLDMKVVRELAAWSLEKGTSTIIYQRTNGVIVLQGWENLEDHSSTDVPYRNN
jgi:hypothetical protein